ncbi:MAG: undecaprenyl/decaprenyl-phosphate alpha-N-acetylglucosaminyl 1-phosphate transferase [Victivallales bacterium]|nr:undecaprenyl/decaprenyl-phosphate alpha-N-acetylglucosaminyl 1-phosphate transferase [Victivallales bacterium]
MKWQLVILLCLGCTAVCSWLLTWAARKAAPALGLVDRPKSEGHKNHRQATPVAGGVAMWAAWFAAFAAGFAALFCWPSLFTDYQALRDGVVSILPQLGLITACATALMFMGMMDDRRPMGAGIKFVFQGAAALLTACFGPRLLVGYLPAWLSILITFFWIAGVINAFNFFDNMDGLAGGTGAIALIFLLVVAGVREQYFVSVFTAATLGAVLGFLAHNRPPAKIFMGDSGSHFMGYLIAVICLLTTFYSWNAAAAPSPTLAPILIPVIILAVPLLDSVTVICIRLKLRKPIYVGDNRHLSHRFAAMGLSRPLSVYLIWLLSFVVGVAGLSLLWLPPVGVFLVIAQILAMMTVILVMQFSTKN